MDSRHARFDALVSAWLPDLYRYAVWLCRDPSLAEDLVQETLLRAWRALDSLREGRAARQWLITILRRELARHFERQRPDKVDIEQLPLADLGGGPEDNLEQSRLRQAMLALDAAYREPLVLQVLLGYSVEEIAEVMHLKTATVLTRLHRARKQLIAQLGEPAGEARA